MQIQHREEIQHREIYNTDHSAEFQNDKTCFLEDCDWSIRLQLHNAALNTESVTL